jgi:hypothetical protein
VNVIDRLQHLDERWGVGPVMTRGQINRLRRQAAADIPRIDPELDRRGRLWAERTLRPVRKQRFLLFAFVALALLAIALTVHAVDDSSFRRTPVAPLAWVLLVAQILGFLNQRRIARHLLLELPWEPRTSDARQY